MSQTKRPAVDRHRHQTPGQVIDDYFLEHRAKLIDLAAFLDRVDRACSGGTGSDLPAGTSQDPSHEDYRLVALRKALAVLSDGQPDRAKRVLEQLSDLTTTPRDAPGAPATGAYEPINQSTIPRSTPPDPEGQA